VKHRLLDGGVAIAAFLGAFLLRTLPGAENVLGGESVTFRTPDSLYHMRVVDLVLARFPRPVLHDPLLLWPSGMDLPTAPLFDYLVASAALLLGRGAPTPYLVDLCGAFLPPLLAGLLAGAAYLLGRGPLGREGAALTAALLSVMPGQLLLRCSLGYADHHAPALLFLGLFGLFLFRSLGVADDRSGRRDALAAGGSLALLSLTWPWGAAFALPAAGWTALEACVRERSRSLARLSLALGAAVLPVLLASMFFPVLRGPGALLFALTLAAGAVHLARTRARRLAVAAASLLVSVVVWLAVAPGAVREILGRMIPSPAARTVYEVLPLLSTGHGLSPLFQEFGTGLFAALLGAGIALKGLRERPENGLLLAFFAFTTALTLAQNRFAGELGIVAALLAGLVPGPQVFHEDGVSTRRAALGRAGYLLGLAVLLVLPPALAVPGAVRSLPPSTDPDWEAAMAWLRERTPDPFSVPKGSPPTSVLTWWDNGYLVTRLGRRIPVTNPTQQEAGWAARALLSEDLDEAVALLRSRAVSHIALDSDLLYSLLPGSLKTKGQFSALAVWADRPPGRYAVPFKVSGPDGTRPTMLFFPDYFRTLAFRLFRHGGRGATPRGPVLAVQLASGAVTDFRRIGSYEEASRFVVAAGRGWRLASEDPYATCIPLEAWPRFRRVFSSAGDALRDGSERVGRVEILEVER